MYALSPERKKYLLRQNRQFKSTNQAAPSSPNSTTTYSASYGPASTSAFLPKLVPQLTGDSGLMRRFSVLGWGSSSENADASPVGSPSRRPSESVGIMQEETQPLQSQTTGGLWSSWWASSGGEGSPVVLDKQASKESAKSAKWYIDNLRVGKAADNKLARHLITLRVHLSTAKLGFILDFVGPERGLVALGTILSSLVGKDGKKRSLTEIETTVLFEVLKCLRVLLNTSVSRGERSTCNLCSLMFTP